MNSSRSLCWITGAGGLIGHALVHAAPVHAPQWNVTGLTRPELDLTDFAAVRRRMREDSPGLVVHCAGLTKSPACEADPALARRLNVDVTANLAEAAAGIPFIFLSTDLVFDGRQGGYDEAAAPNPLGVYAETKLAAERLVLANPKHTVVRTSLNGGTSPTGDRGFNEELRRAWQSGRTPKLFVDEFRCPIPARITARAIWELASLNRPGLYHLAGAERLSRHRIGELLAARWPGLNPLIEGSSVRDYKGPPRPADSSLNSEQIQRMLSFPLPGLTAWLETHPDEIF